MYSEIAPDYSLRIHLNFDLTPYNFPYRYYIYVLIRPLPPMRNIIYIIFTRCLDKHVFPPSLWLYKGKTKGPGKLFFSVFYASLRPIKFNHSYRMIKV